MSLFKLGDFILHSGQQTDWIIDCNTFSDEAINALAYMATKILPPFGTVTPVMRGGLRLAMALAKYSQEGGQLLIAEDVLTTGNAMEEIRDGRNCLGITIFARGKPPTWVKALWYHPDAL